MGAAVGGVRQRMGHQILRLLAGQIRKRAGPVLG